MNGLHIFLGALITLSLPLQAITLTDPILKIIDGGFFDKTKAIKTMRMIRQIRTIHEGVITLNSEGRPDPLNGTPQEIYFQGKKQTLSSLIEIEKNRSQLTYVEQLEFDALFQLVKDYFESVHNIMLDDARGAQQMMYNLIFDYCKKSNRTSSLLLKWDENGHESETYKRDVTSFAIFQVFTNDLKNFLAALIKSCPKTYAELQAELKKN